MLERQWNFLVECIHYSAASPFLTSSPCRSCDNQIMQGIIGREREMSRIWPIPHVFRFLMTNDWSDINWPHSALVSNECELKLCPTFFIIRVKKGDYLKLRNWIFKSEIWIIKICSLILKILIMSFQLIMFTFKRMKSKFRIMTVNSNYKTDPSDNENEHFKLGNRTS